MSRSSRGSSRPRASVADVADRESQAYLIDRVIALLDRTFAEVGRGEGLKMVREMLLRLDRGQLRDLLHEFGIDAPEELEEAEREDRR